MRIASTCSIVLLTTLLFWTPLPFGSVGPRSVLILEILAFLALASAILAGKRSPGSEDTGIASWWWSVTVTTMSLAGIAVLGAAQSLTWPKELVKALSPGHSSVQEQAAEMLGALGLSGSSTLSVAPSESQTSALIWLAVAACFAAAAIVGRTRHHRRALASALAGAALIQVFYGAGTLGTGLIWGVEVPHDPSRLRGTFVNPDHMAVYLEIGIAVIFACAWWSFRRARWESRHERRALWIVPPVTLWLILFTGLAFSGSRAGLVAAIVAVVVQGFLVAWMLRRWRVGLVGAGAVLAGFAVVAAFGLQQGLGRWMSTSSQDLTWNLRYMAYDAAWDLWQQFPWTGTGLGTFHEAFTLVQPRELPRLWTNAHNDYLELLVTTGMIGISLFLPGLVFCAARLVRVLRRGERSEDRAAALAGLGGLAALALHSCFDFGLTIPANAVALAIVCGAAAGAQVVPRSEIRRA